jgi:hypothetical protein
MAVTNAVQFEHFFREAGSLDVDKEDLRRYGEFVNHKVGDLLLRGKAAANADGRDIIQPSDLPITKGLQEDIERFREIDRDLKMEPILDDMADRPYLGYAYSDETQAALPEIAGGVSVALARSFRILEPGLKNPGTADWERSFRLFDLVL